MKTLIFTALVLSLSGCASTSVRVVSQEPNGCTNLGAIEVDTKCSKATGSDNLEIRARGGSYCDDAIRRRLLSAAKKKGGDTVWEQLSYKGVVYRCAAK